jgi:hypothetical protein
MPQCGRLRSMGVCGFESTNPPLHKIDEEMKGAPYWPRREGHFLRFSRSATRLIETFGTGLLPRSFGLGAALLLGVAHADGDHVPGQIGFHEAATPIADKMDITAIRLFVLGLLVSIITKPSC